MDSLQSVAKLAMGQFVAIKCIETIKFRHISSGDCSKVEWASKYIRIKNLP